MASSRPRLLIDTRDDGDPLVTPPDAMLFTKSKLAPPLRPAHPVALDRHRLRLAALHDHSLCLVHAPSGYGKSTLGGDWYHALAALGCRAGWVSFDYEDDESARAISYIMEAVRSALASPALGVGGEGWIHNALVPPVSIATRLINAIHDSAAPFALFLDDVDRLTDPRILQFLNYLLLHCPANLHIVLIYQTQPALPLAHLNHRGMVLRVGVEDLRLRDDEACELLTGSGVGLDESEILILNKAMGGWVTGLRIGSAALRNNHDALFDIGLTRHSAHWLSDYLDENILHYLTPAYRRFLTHSAIVETVSASLCRALTGMAEAEDMLHWLAEQNLFVQQLDDDGAWFRIHPVFREFLLAQLTRNDPGALPQLHDKASRWFAGQGRLAEAIGHAFEGGDAEGAAELIAQAAMPMLERSDVLPLLGWIARLPAAVIEDRIPLRLAEAWALTLCLRPQARPLLDDLRTRVGQLPDDAARMAFQHELAGIETIFLAVCEDRLDAAVSQGQSFLEATRDEGSFVERAVRNAAAYCELHRGDHRLVHDMVRPAQLYAQRDEQIFPTAYRHAIIGSCFRAQGQLDEAERTFRTGHDLSDRLAGPHSASSALLAPFLARSLYERDNLPAAAAVLDGRMPIVDEACFHEAVIHAYLVSVRIAAQQGLRAEAASLIEHIELLGYERGWRRLQASSIVERARLGLPQTMDADALLPIELEEAAIARPLSLDARVFAILAEVRVYAAIDASDRPRLNQVADRLAQLAEQTNDTELKLKAALFMVLPQLSGRCDRLVDLDTINLLNHAAQSGFRRTIQDVLEVTGVGAMAQLANGGYAPNSFLSLVQQVGEARASTRASANDASLTGITVFSILTSREIDVLTAVGNGDSNKEIARRLHLTPETVKWHLKNVMRKLGAEDRAEAVRNASTLGLSLAPA
ncbi:LuxR C-terminal-related transcriptional regulator [Sphingomonas sp.]|uniref:LuxR C-terminal-related transcriptional regulator n=1 Tax=Sphingomonas sp. TaxID=28214 RepID=UPI003D6D8B2C